MQMHSIINMDKYTEYLKSRKIEDYRINDELSIVKNRLAKDEDVSSEFMVEDSQVSH